MDYLGNNTIEGSIHTSNLDIHLTETEIDAKVGSTSLQDVFDTDPKITIPTGVPLKLKGPVDPTETVLTVVDNALEAPILDILGNGTITTSQTVFADQDLVTKKFVNEDIKPYCIVYKTAAQAIPHGTFTNVVWDTLVGRSSVEWNVAGNYFNITRAGLYQVNYEVSFASNVSGSRVFFIDSSSDSRRHGATSIIGNSVLYCCGSALIVGSIGTQISLKAYQSTGADLNCGSGSGALYENEMSIHFVTEY